MTSYGFHFPKQICWIQLHQMCLITCMWEICMQEILGTLEWSWVRTHPPGMYLIKACFKCASKLWLWPYSQPLGLIFSGGSSEIQTTHPNSKTQTSPQNSRAEGVFQEACTLGCPKTLGLPLVLCPLGWNALLRKAASIYGGLHVSHSLFFPCGILIWDMVGVQWDPSILPSRANSYMFWLVGRFCPSVSCRKFCLFCYWKVCLFCVTGWLCVFWCVCKFYCKHGAETEMSQTQLNVWKYGDCHMFCFWACELSVFCVSCLYFCCLWCCQLPTTTAVMASFIGMAQNLSMGFFFGGGHWI